MKRVLIPTDFSENAWNAIKYAICFFEKYPITFVLVYVNPLDHASEGIDSLKQHETRVVLHINKIIQTLDNTKKRMLQESSINETQIITDYITSPFIAGIKSLIKNNKTEFIVMGTKGFSNNDDIIIGSHTNSIITKIKVPLLIIPKDAKFNTILNIAFPTDHDILYQSKVINTLTSITALHHSNLKILSVENSKVDLTSFQLKNRDYLKDYLKSLSSSFHKVNHLQFEEGLQVFVDLMHIDMIALMAKNLNFFQKLLFKPTVDKMGYRTKIPFLVLHD